MKARAAAEAEGIEGMGYRAVARVLGLRFTTAQHRAAQYLERQGLRFCVHWGRDNAIALAREHWRARRRRRRSGGQRV